MPWLKSIRSLTTLLITLLLGFVMIYTVVMQPATFEKIFGLFSAIAILVYNWYFKEKDRINTNK
jgi:hypothetical protein